MSLISPATAYRCSSTPPITRREYAHRILWLLVAFLLLDCGAGSLRADGGAPVVQTEDPEVVAVRSDMKGRVYTLSARSRRNPILRIYPSALSGQAEQIVLPFDELATKTTMSMELFWPYLYVARTVESRGSLTRYEFTEDGESVTILPDSVLVRTNCPGTIEAMAVNPNGTLVHVTGRIINGASVTTNYWATFDKDLKQTKSPATWSWNSSTSTDRTTLNGKPTALTVDTSGAVYVAGYWQDPQDDPDDKTEPHLGDFLDYSRIDGPGIPSGKWGFAKNFNDLSRTYKRTTPYIFKFQPDGTQAVASRGEEDRNHMGIIKDIKFVSDRQGRGSILVFQEWEGQSRMGEEAVAASENESGVHERRDVMITRLDTELRPLMKRGAWIKSAASGAKSSDQRAGSFSLDSDGNLYVVGVIQTNARVEFVSGKGNADTLLVTNRLSSTFPSFFRAKLRNDLTWEWVKPFSEQTYYAPGEIVTAAYVPGQLLLVAGKVRTGRLTFPALSPGGEVTQIFKAFVTLFANDTGESIESQFVTIRSISHAGSYVSLRRLDGSKISMSNELGDPRAIGAIGLKYIVEVPPVLYVDATDSLMDSPTQAQIEESAVTRYTCTGYSVANSDSAGTSSSYTFEFKEPITITFHWRTEHALTIDSDLEGTRAIFEPTSKGWIKDPRGYGLTTKGAGNPSPGVNKHWIEEGSIATATIEGIVYESGQLGVRYAIAGYTASGAAAGTNEGTITRLLTRSQSRQQVIPDQDSAVGFYVDRPATVTWLWKPQFQVSQSTTSSRSSDLPGIQEGPPGIQTTNVILGSGQFWFDEGSRLIVGAASDSGPGRRLAGVRFANGGFTPTSSTTTDTLLGNFGYDNRKYLGSAIANLDRSVTVVWDFGDPIYRQYVTIGNPISTLAERFDPPLTSSADLALLGLIDTNIAPRARIISAPSGSVDADMQVFDTFDHKSFPLRPGSFFLEWAKRPPVSPEDSDLVIMEIHSGFQGDGYDGTNVTTHSGGVVHHYRHVAHPEMPAVVLDPDSNDTNFFSGLKFTESDGLVQNGGFTAQGAGRHVLLYSQLARTNSTSPAATGNPLNERLAVRIVETRSWNTTNHWVSGAMLKTNNAAIPIGSKLTSPNDLARLNSGFIVYTNARYNANIYNRNQPNGGPIIPVNRQFTGKAEDNLVIVWYENYPAGSNPEASAPSNLLWPYYPEVFTNVVWPTQSSFTRNSSTNITADLPLDRIVIASRLGSEGRNSAYQVQSSFDPLRYDQVKIYNQPDRNLPGFNPNEEHALIAPSFKQLDLPSPPPTAYALRQDWNVTSLDERYTSDPYVLVEYLDKTVNEFKMAVYAVEKEDHWPDLNAYRYPEMEADTRDLDPVDAEIKESPAGAAGPSKTLSKSKWVIADFSTTETNEMRSALTAIDADLSLQPSYPPALIASSVVGYFLTNSDPAVRAVLDNPFNQDSPEREDIVLRQRQRLDGLEARINQAETANNSQFKHQFDQTIQAGRRTLARFKTSQREFPYTFRYGMKAGEPVQPPYPLPLVIGLTPCSASTGHNFPTNRVYWEDHKGGPWAVSQGSFSADVYYPLSPNFWPGEGSQAKVPGECILFPTQGETVIVGRSTDWRPTYATSFTISMAAKTFSVVYEDDRGSGPSTRQKFVAQINSSRIPDFRAALLPSQQLEFRFSTTNSFTVREGSGNPLATAGILPPGMTKASEGATTNVSYTASWPSILPILKAGETLTFAGGEYKADHPGPEQPGLPGVLGWAAGSIIYDALNPSMSNTNSFTDYTAQLISPLEERQISLKIDLGFPDAAITAFRDLIQPARSLTKTVGVRWQFRGFSASLGKRLFFDPLKNTLIFKGLLNEKTLGDSTLTAPPPPVHVLEPNILTRRERDELLNYEKLKYDPVWRAAILKLYALCRNPQSLTSADGAEPKDPYYPGLELDVQQKDGSDLLDEDDQPITLINTARPRKALGPGMALVPSPRFLSQHPSIPRVSYVTMVENDNPTLGGPISVHIVKVDQRYRYRGAIKTILSDNVFDEKITLRHTGDFGGNGDDIVYQWFYREENGAQAPLPPSDAWQLFTDSSDNRVKGLGLYHISLDGSGGLLLGDNLFFVRYRHVGDVPFGQEKSANSVDWGSARLADDSGRPLPAFGNGASDFGTIWNRDGASFRDSQQRDPTNPLRFGGEWAGAANSPTVDFEYRPQLVMGWIKRVLDRVNPYEARFSDFRNNESPATYASMIQQAGQPYVGPVALNPAKDVIENVGLIELYQTVLERGINLSIGLSSPLSTAGINNALLLAVTRISDLYMLLGNEAYTDALDPTIGFGSRSVEYGSLAPSVFSFQNQLPSLLDEELGLLRGINDDRRRPMHNRLFWNFTKGEGEVAYAMNYNIKDVNQDGFIDENDALVQYPQGHGDAWGHYLTALKSRYRLLRHPFFSWQPRSEFYNLLDVVIEVDFLDERKFAEVAAAKAQAGTEILNLTYRSRYVEDPDGQWQGYSDPTPAADSIPRDNWGVDGWARRVGQGALFDWMTANALIPWMDTNRTGIARVDRTTVSELATVAANLGSVQTTYDNANSGLNPLGLNSDVVPFDIDPTFLDVGSTAQIGRRAVQGLTHFEQIFERAFATTKNALTAFDYANENKNRLRQVADTVDGFRQDVIQQDMDYRNRLIEIFGTPYAGAIGTGKPYPAGYKGPDLSLYMYVDVREVTPATVPVGSEEYRTRLYGFAADMPSLGGPFQGLLQTQFLDPLYDESETARRGFNWWTGVLLTDNSIVDLKLPASAGSYTFQAPTEWGSRAASGRLQSIISDMVQTEAELAVAVGDYDGLIVKIEDGAELLQAKIETANGILRTMTGVSEAVKSTGQQIAILELIKDLASFTKSALEGAFSVLRTAVDIWGIVGVDNGTNAQGAAAAAAAVTAENSALAAAQISAEAAEGQSKATRKAALEAVNSAIAKSVVANENFRTLTGKEPTPANLKKAQSAAAQAKQVSRGEATRRFLDQSADSKFLSSSADGVSSFNDLIETHAELALSILQSEADRNIEFHTQWFEIFERIKELQQTASSEGPARIRVFELMERLRSQADQYRTALDEGFRLVEERRNFNIKTAGDTQQNRYQDMSFRVARNQALKKYRASFDLAQKYVYMAAKAYDYETNLEDNERGAAKPLLNEIIRQRTLGRLTEDEPTHGAGGLSEILATLRDNFTVLEGQMGLNNPQLEQNTFSLRKEQFLLSADSADAGRWSDVLKAALVPDLWNSPEFLRFCRPFAPRVAGVNEPGLIFKFQTDVTSGNNFFGGALSAGDSAYDPSSYATRIRAVAVKFPGYSVSQWAATPRVYLIPIGNDRMYYPNSRELRIRDWNIVDQRIPVPFKTGTAHLNDPAWISAIDGLSGTMGEIRRYSSFRAVPVEDEEAEPEDVLDTRLTGRSVWNNQWLLVIPGRSLLSNPDVGLDSFIKSVTDIRLTLQTYGNSGN